jgi:hypothetical protein
MELPITATTAVTTTTTTTTTTSTPASFVEECEQRTRTYVASHIQPRYDAQQQQQQPVPMNGHEDDTITIMMIDGHRKHLQQARGKVRDRFWMDSATATADDDSTRNNNNSSNNSSNNNNNILVLRTTDRQSGFDRMLAVVPYKGAVLNLCSQYWFQHTSDIIHNHLLSVPHPTMAVVRKCQPFPIEFVVRYVTLC